MQNAKGLLRYFLVITFFVGIIFLVSTWGSDLHSGSISNEGSAYAEKSTSLENTLANPNWDKYFHDPQKPFILVLLQLMVIITVARFCGFLATKIGQQKVVGEIVAGIALGPSLLAQFTPETYEFLFPAYSHTSLYVLSQLGLILFMFIIGMEVDIALLRSQSKKGVFISHSTIAFTTLLGFILSIFLYENYATAGTSFTEFALFIAVSLSITAFPVMARILQERNMLRSSLGSLMMSIAAIDDVTAWCLLAAAVGLVSSSSIAGAMITIGLMLLYTAIMFFVVRPLLARTIPDISREKEKVINATGAVFMVLLCSAFTTRFIGVHALFGAFVAGIVIPDKAHFREIVTHKIKDISTLVLLPVFFTLAGLRAHVELLQDIRLILLLVIVVLIAMFGKIVGGIIFARLSRVPFADALRVGALLNTRGLMEIIVLNIGLDLNIISTELYTVFLLMALITTFTTAPLLNLIDRLFPRGISEEHMKLKEKISQEN